MAEHRLLSGWKKRERNICWAAWCRMIPFGVALSGLASNMPNDGVS